MQNKYIVAILVSGMVVTVIGALLKITHTEFSGVNGNHILIVGLVLEAIAGALFISKLMSENKKNDFSNK